MIFPGHPPDDQPRDKEKWKKFAFKKTITVSNTRAPKTIDGSRSAFYSSESRTDLYQTEYSARRGSVNRQGNRCL